MTAMDRLQDVILERFQHRPAGIDKLDRLWDAAVLIPLVQTEEGICVLFEKRAQSLRRQPGEVCFPGGRFECGDAGFDTTAVRETCEELGLDPGDISLCAELDVLVTHNGPIIHPFVGVIEDISQISLNPDEVECVFTVPLKSLLEQVPARGSTLLADHPGDDFPFHLVPQKQRGWRMNKKYYVYFYRYNEHIIWGLTARMLFAFLHRARKELTDFLADPGDDCD